MTGTPPAVTVSLLTRMLREAFEGPPGPWTYFTDTSPGTGVFGTLGGTRTLWPWRSAPSRTRRTISAPSGSDSRPGDAGRRAQSRDEQRQVALVALRLQALHRNEAQRGGVDAVAQPGGRRAVVEQVPQMGIGVCRPDFGPRREERPIGL